MFIGKKYVHSEMCNGIIKHGTYRFGADGKLVEGSYVAPKKQKKKKRKSRKKLSKQLQIAILCVACALLLFIAADLCFGWSSHRNAPSYTAPDTSGGDLLGPIQLPADQEEVYLCAASLQQYYRGEISMEKAFARNQDAYKPFVFKYKLDEKAGAVLHLDGQDYILDPNASSITIDNLMTGKNYEYTVSVTEGEGDAAETSEYTGSFTTADTNRFLTVPGLSNVRDIGHYRTNDGKRIKEGMIIRGTEIDGLEVGKYFLTDKTAVEPFGFRLDMDLRSADIHPNLSQSRLGENVKHRFFNAPEYGGIFTDSAKPILLAIFSALSEPENYPIYMHCTYGADRTGTIVYLLQGLLGVSEEDMELEYRLTAFDMPYYATNTELNGIIGGLDGMAGDSINEKIYLFLTQEIGLTVAQIRSIRSILLEDPAL